MCFKVINMCLYDGIDVNFQEKCFSSAKCFFPMTRAMIVLHHSLKYIVLDPFIRSERAHWDLEQYMFSERNWKATNMGKPPTIMIKVNIVRYQHWRIWIDIFINFSFRLYLFDYICIIPWILRQNKTSSLLWNKIRYIH